MTVKFKIFLLSVISTLFFTYFSYTVAKENWQQIDFDTTVKLQDRIPRKLDEYLSFLSLLGSAEVTVGFCIVMAFLYLVKFHWVAVVGWAMIVLATVGEMFGKLILFHPAPPVFMHRTILPSVLPKFYIHTNFSYPSGHMMRTVFIASVIICLIMTSKIKFEIKVFLLLPIVFVILIMGLSRIYLGEHWLSDVLGGTLWGIATGLFASVLILPSKRGIKGVAA